MSEARAHVDEWVAAGLLLQRGAKPTIELLTLARPWVEATLEILAVLPPIGVVADLGRLLARAPFDIAKSEPVADPELRAAIDAYEEHVLGRLAADYRLETARDALVRLDESLRPAAIAVFVEQVLARIQQARASDELDSPGPAAIRRVIHRHGLDLLELGGEALDGQDFVELRRELARAYADLAQSARQCGALIGDVELYTLENHTALRSPSLRLAMAQIAEAAQVIERHMPVRVRRSEATRGRTPTKVEDESAYPIGGYASISTIGGIESLVSSELIYMSPPHEREAGEVDLFDVRWAAGELLKYTRDESVHTRERRTICFAFAPSLEAARVKDPGVPFQRLVVTFGGVVAGIRKLCAWLDEAELHLHLLLLARPLEEGRLRRQPLSEEGELARLLLREYIESGVVQIIELDSPTAAREYAEEAASIGGSDLVWLRARSEITCPLGTALPHDGVVARRSSTPGTLPPRASPSRRSSAPNEQVISERALIAEPRQPSASEQVGQRKPGYREHTLDVDDARPLLCIDTGRGLEEHTGRSSGWDAWIKCFVDLCQALV